MPTIAATGWSTHRRAREAAGEAVAQVLAAVGGAVPSFALVFATAGHDQAELLAELKRLLPGTRLSGCSGEGVIAAGVSDESEYALAVMAVHSETLEFVPLIATEYADAPAAAGESLARQVRTISRGDEFALLLFPDGLLGNCGEMLQALDRGLPRPLRIAGGAAGDGLVFERTWQYLDGEAHRGAVSAVLVRGRGRMELAVSHGCSPLGLERRVSRAEGGWMREIDGQPAWSVFREYLEGCPEELNTEGSIHLSVGEPLPADAAADYEPFIIRTPMGLDKATGALFFPGGGIAQGRAIRMTRRDPEQVRDGARRCAARLAALQPGRSPALVLQFDCAGRGKQLFGSRTAEYIVQPLMDALGARTPWVGFHTYGEIAPVGGETHYHNLTVALCALYDEA